MRVARRVHATSCLQPSARRSEWAPSVLPVIGARSRESETHSAQGGLATHPHYNSLASSRHEDGAASDGEDGHCGSPFHRRDFL